MPVEIVFQHKPQNVTYAVIGQAGYGRMDETTPTQGLATFNASSSTAVVGHCPELKRTVLIHSQNYMFVKETLEPIFDWIVANGEEEIYTEHKTLEVVVIRGYLHRDLEVLAIGGNHTEFMKELSEFVTATYAEHSINIVDAEPLIASSKGSFLVDKITAKITILRLPLVVDNHNTLCTSPYNERQMCREIFARDLFPFIYNKISKVITSRHLQFDINRYTLHGSISDPCRLVLRWKCGLSQSDMDLLHLLKHLNICASFMKYANLRKALELPAVKGLPCERCPKEGSLKCSNCRGAWYCGRAHQREDWPQHKQFCKTYSINK